MSIKGSEDGFAYLEDKLDVNINEALREDHIEEVEEYNCSSFSGKTYSPVIRLDLRDLKSELGRAEYLLVDTRTRNCLYCREKQEMEDVADRLSRANKEVNQNEVRFSESINGYEGSIGDDEAVIFHEENEGAWMVGSKISNET